MGNMCRIVRINYEKKFRIWSWHCYNKYRKRNLIELDQIYPLVNFYYPTGFYIRAKWCNNHIQSRHSYTYNTQLITVGYCYGLRRAYVLLLVVHCRYISGWRKVDAKNYMVYLCLAVATLGSDCNENVFKSILLWQRIFSSICDITSNKA